MPRQVARSARLQYARLVQRPAQWWLKWWYLCVWASVPSLGREAPLKLHQRRRAVVPGSHSCCCCEISKGWHREARIAPSAYDLQKPLPLQDEEDEVH